MSPNITLTLILVVMTCIISFQSFSNMSMKQKLIFHPFTVKRNSEWYRFISHGFIHADWGHLLINMFVLYQFGDFIEKAFANMFGLLPGKLIFLTLYLGAIIIGALPSYFKHQDNNYYAALGASGGTSGVVFAFILFDPWQWFAFPPLPALIFGIGYLMYSSYMGKRGGDNIGHDAHFWGAVFGFATTLIASAILRPDLLEYFMNQLLAGPRGF